MIAKEAATSPRTGHNMRLNVGSVVRRILVQIVVITLVMGQAASANSFEINVHGQITRSALRPGLDLAPATLERIVSANEESDRHQFDEHRHFDSAPDRAAICTRWRAGIDTWLSEIVAYVEPDGQEKRRLKDRDKALDSLGRVLHAIQDFYSHSNYVELGLPTPTPDFLLASCQPAALPQNLQTGYFNAAYYSPASPHPGCPLTLRLAPDPPAPFRFCHSQLHKDGPSRPRHAAAKAHATAATKHAWEEVRRRIIAKYGSDETIDAECLFTKFAWDGDRTCHRLWRLTGEAHARGASAGGPLEFSMDLDIRLKWEPTRYSGPTTIVEAPAVADVAPGEVRHAMNLPGWSCLSERRETRNYAPPGTILVTPNPEPLKFSTLVPPLGGFGMTLSCTGQYGVVINIPLHWDCTQAKLKLDVERVKIECTVPYEAWIEGEMKLDTP